MRKPVQLALVIHNHQPVGNFDAVIDEACSQAYLPFLKELLKYPNIRIGLHTSGCLLEWLQFNRPEYFELARELVKRGQLELLGGGMYEPILPVLPARDAHRQLVRMSDYIEENFGQRPTGMWCPERVWEPHLPPILAGAGLKYTLLDDFHFRSSALPAQVAGEYFTTEHEGQQFSLLPISKELRYTIPFKPLEDTLDHLQLVADSQDGTKPLIVFGDDGEKFGVWPDTYEWVYERGWMNEFLTGLTENLDWIDLRLPGEIVATRQPAGKVFIPCSSYMEMGEWTRVDPDASKDDPPGFWRNYMHKYPLANQMYRKMMFVSSMLAEPGASASPAFTTAQANLGRGQCNCAYWHGIFGGLYLNYLRHAVYYHLLKAEQELERGTTLAKRPGLQLLDHDGLGWDQVLARGNEIDALLDPGRGLCLTRLDYLPTQYCWSNVMTRRREAYHKLVPLAVLKENDTGHESIHDRIITKEEGLAHKLVFDAYPRWSFITYFSKLDNLESLVEVPSNPIHICKSVHNDYFLQAKGLHKNATVVKAKVQHEEFALEKSVRLTNNGLSLSVKLAHGKLPVDDGLFCIEFNFTLLTDQSPERRLHIDGNAVSLDKLASQSDAHSVELVDGWQHRKLKLQSQSKFKAVCYPVKTVSSSEGGFESTYQGSCVILAAHPLTLQEGLTIELSITEAS
jgi:4-alpha-glucanotransferase